MLNKRIEILGCTASGKTTLCHTLNELGWNAIYEPYIQNPFLEKFFYGEKCSFELQMCFLLQHFNAIETKSFASKNICDFSFALDSLYASILLDKQEKIVYDNLYDYFISKIGRPYCLIKLTCPDDVIVDRLQRRNRDYESNINLDFLKKLNKGATDFTTSEYCIEIDSSKIDISKADEVKKHLLSSI